MHFRKRLWRELAGLWRSASPDQRRLLAGAAAMICLGIIALAARNMRVNFCVALAAFAWCVYVTRWSAGRLTGNAKWRALRIMRPALIVCGLALVGITAWIATGWLLS